MVLFVMKNLSFRHMPENLHPLTIQRQIISLLCDTLSHFMHINPDPIPSRQLIFSFSDVLAGSFFLLLTGPVEVLLHAPTLHRVELDVHGGLRHPGRLEAGRILVHQVCVLGPTRTAKVLHLSQHSINIRRVYSAVRD